MLRGLQLVVTSALALAGAAMGGTHDPCADQDALGKGDSFTIGIAWWPGSTVDSWVGINPCTYEGRQVLIRNGVQTGVYRPQMDALTVVRSTREAEERVFNSAVDDPGLCTQSCNQDLMTVVAYTGNATRVRSEARVVWSKSSDSTVGTGRVVSLALVARFDEGRLKYLQFHDLGCGECGGKGSERCVDGLSCADAHEDCECDPEGTASCLYDLEGADFNRCRLAVHVAFAGTDKHSEPMDSGNQILRLKDFSVSAKGKEQAEAAIAKGQELRDQASGTIDSVSDSVGSVTGR